MTFIDSLSIAWQSQTNSANCAFVDPWGRITFAETRRKVENAVKRLRHQQCREGDRIAALTFSGTDAVILEWATYLIGATWIGVPWRERKPDNVISILKACSPMIFYLEKEVLDDNDYDYMVNSPRFRFLRGEKQGRFECFKAAEKRQDDQSFHIRGSQIIRIRFTSGSSGEAKGIVYTQKTQDVIFENISEWIIHGRKEIMIHGAPVVWASGSLIAPVFAAGGCSVILPKWNPVRFVEAVWVNKGTVTFLVPKMLSSLIDYSEKNGTGWAGSLTRILLAGGPAPVPIVKRALTLFKGKTLFVTLGMTEASFPITWHEVVNEDVRRESNPRPYVPLGKVTPFYSKSGIGKGKHTRPNLGELLVVGEAVAPGVWTWSDEPAAEPPHAVWLRRPHQSWDIVERERDRFHYVCRKDDSCEEKGIWVAADAIEAVLRECKGVKEARVNRARRILKAIHIDVAIQPTMNGLAKGHIRKFFIRRAAGARLEGIVVDGIDFAAVELTPTGKPVRSGAMCSEEGARKIPEFREWDKFNFSELASGPLYFYVGAGLSMASGLVGWDEMASVIWWYLKQYERREKWKKGWKERPPADEDENAGFLHEFVAESMNGQTRARILQHNTRDERALGRAALLNMLLRYRAPKTKLSWEANRCEAKPMVGRTRCGREPIAEDLILQSLVWQSGCHGVFTPNYDMLLENAFSMFHHGSALRSYRYNADFLRYIMSNPHFVLKIHGDVTDLARMQLDPEISWRKGGLAKGHGTDLKRVYRAALEKGHMVYLGLGFRDRTIARLHEYARRFAEVGNCRVALIPTSEGERIALISGQAGTPGGIFGDILFLTYDDKGNNGQLGTGSIRPAVRGFLERIVGTRSDQPRVEDHVCREAADIHKQVFLSPLDKLFGKRFATELWTCNERRHRQHQGRGR